MKIVRGSIYKMRIEKTGMTVITRGLNVFVESSHRGRSSCPCARLRSGGAVIKVVIDSDGRLSFVHLRFVQRNQAARPGVDDVVGKNIVSHVVLHLELTRPRS